MATHRLYARPFALGLSGRRCLWCGRTDVNGPRLTLSEPAGETSWRACGEAHADRLARVFAVAHRWRWGLRAGILGGLAVFLAGAVASAAVPSLPFSFGDASAFFRLSVALVVTPFGWLAATVASPREAAIRVPFPVHVQALIGTSGMLWLFRLVGVLWLATGVGHFVSAS